MSAAETGRVVVDNEPYGLVKAATDKFFATIRQARSNETEGKTNQASTGDRVGEQIFLFPIHNNNVQCKLLRVHFQYLRVGFIIILLATSVLERDTRVCLAGGQFNYYSRSVRTSNIIFVVIIIVFRITGTIGLRTVFIYYR